VNQKNNKKFLKDNLDVETLSLVGKKEKTKIFRSYSQKNAMMFSCIFWKVFCNFWNQNLTKKCRKRRVNESLLFTAAASTFFLVFGFLVFNLDRLPIAHLLSCFIFLNFLSNCCEELLSL